MNKRSKVGPDGYLIAEYQSRAAMTLCQHDDCDREGIAAWNGCVFCDEHVRERLRTTADNKLLSRVAELEAALRFYIDTFPAFRYKPLGAPGSATRQKQVTHIEWEAKGRPALETK